MKHQYVNYVPNLFGSLQINRLSIGTQKTTKKTQIK
jgi:hypothetical protein